MWRRNSASTSTWSVRGMVMKDFPSPGDRTSTLSPRSRRPDLLFSRDSGLGLCDKPCSHLGGVRTPKTVKIFTVQRAQVTISSRPTCSTYSTAMSHRELLSEAPTPSLILLPEALFFGICCAALSLAYPLVAFACPFLIGTSPIAPTSSKREPGTPPAIHCMRISSISRRRSSSNQVHRFNSTQRSSLR